MIRPWQHTASLFANGLTRSDTTAGFRANLADPHKRAGDGKPHGFRGVPAEGEVDHTHAIEVAHG